MQGKGSQKAVTRGAARRYLNYRLSQNGNRDQPNARPGGKRSSLCEMLKSLQEGKSVILAHTFSGWEGCDGGLGHDGFRRPHLHPGSRDGSHPGPAWLDVTVPSLDTLRGSP